MPIAPGTRFGRYEIRSHLGAGGMGEVYLAEDTRLNRKIALKLLPADFTNDKNRLGRFEQEACAASALNHPNILTIYEIGTEGDMHFIATEFIDGATLRAALANRAMTINDVLDIATQVASALVATHEAGIIHRDVKPENIMLRKDGYVKVLDFGLAKLTERIKESQQSDSQAPTKALVNTGAGTIMGTAQYMSPEQARGLPVDKRTDIWSLGVVLYECVAGRVPFEGELATDVVVSITQKEPPPLARYSNDVPPKLEWIISKALRKDREARYQTVKELLTDLRELKHQLEFEAELERSAAPETISGATVSTAREQATAQPTDETAPRISKIATPHSTASAQYPLSVSKSNRARLLIALAALLVVGASFAIYFLYIARSGKEINSIAVLPLVNADSDPDTEYLSDGITETLINKLSQLPGLRVIARSTVFRYKGKEIDPQQFGRELGVSAVLTGRVITRGNTLTIQVDLVNVADGSQIWGERYERQVSDLVAVQQDISREISEKLRLKLSGDEQKQMSRRETTNTEAYQLYLRGRFYWNKRTGDDLRKSIEYFRQAVALDPNFALAHAALADAYNVATGYAPYQSSKEAFPKAREAAIRALELDDTLAEAHTALGMVKGLYEWEWAEAEKEFKRAIELNPSYANGHYFYADALLSRMGRYDEAIVEFKRALELDPLSLIINANFGRVFYYMRDYDRAIEQHKKTLEIEPNFSGARRRMAEAYEQKGMYEEALAEYSKVNDPNDIDAANIKIIRESYTQSGTRGFWQKRLELATKENYPPANRAGLAAMAGDIEQAFQLLEKAYQERDWIVTTLKIGPRFDSLRDDPRYTRLLQRMNLAP